MPNSSLDRTQSRRIQRDVFSKSCGAAAWGVALAGRPSCIRGVADAMTLRYSARHTMRQGAATHRANKRRIAFATVGGRPANRRPPQSRARGPATGNHPFLAPLARRMSAVPIAEGARSATLARQASSEYAQARSPTAGGSARNIRAASHAMARFAFQRCRSSACRRMQIASGRGSFFGGIR